MFNISEIQKGKLKGLFFPVIFAALMVLAGSCMYGWASRSPSHDIYAVASFIPEGEAFSADNLRAVSVQFSDSELLKTVVPVGGLTLTGDESFDGLYTALRDLNAGGFLTVDDYIEGYVPPTENTGGVDLPENLLVTNLSLGQLPQGDDPRITTQSGIYHLITTTYPPRHIACVYQPDTGGLIVDPEDYNLLSPWIGLASGYKALRHTADECPIGGYPLRCGVLTQPYGTEQESSLQPETADENGEEITEEQLAERLPSCIAATPADLVAAWRVKNADNSEARIPAEWSGLLNDPDIEEPATTVTSVVPDAVLPDPSTPEILEAEILEAEPLTAEELEQLDLAETESEEIIG